MPFALGALLTPLLLAATYVGLPIVLNNAQLGLLSSYQYFAVLRLGVNAVGDAPAQWFVPSSSACTISGGDVGSQVPSADGGCFVAAFAAGPADVREWGAKPDDGTHPDAGAAINRACAGYNDVLVPITPAGFYVKTPVVCATGRLGGQLATPINPYPATGFADQSWLNCDSTVAKCLSIGASSGVAITQPLQISDLVVSYNTTPAPSGATAISVLNSYNVTLDNVHVYNADTCMLIKGEGVSANLTLINVGVDRCQSHWYVWDQWNVLTFLGGNDGTGAFNGVGGDPEYTGSADVYEFTASTGGTNYQGPNTITMVGHTYVNPSGGAACLFNWTNFNPTTPNFATAGGELKISDGHFEQHGFVGSALGTFCTDSTVPIINNAQISDNIFTMGSTSFGFFAFNSVTALKQWRVTDNAIGGCGSVTLAPTPASGPAFQDVTFADNTGCVSASFTSNGVGTNTLSLRGNDWNALTIAGSWNRLVGLGDSYTSLTDTATGNVTWLNPLPVVTFTPVLECGGTPCSSLGSPWTVTYPTAFAFREGTGFDVSLVVNVGTKGTATGAMMTVGGLPYTCQSAYAAAAPNVTMSGMTASDVPSASAQIGSSSSVVYLYTLAPTGTGLTGMTDAAFASGSQIQMYLHCGRTS